MRTLKKSLALVLALVMVLGLGVIGASADNALDNYTDASEIGDAYYEAVGVLTGLGIIDGMTETTIEPTGTYTREQAAKIIATMVLGVKNAESLTCVEAPFDDVPADRWSAGYIAFCVEQGIIDGMTDTTFEPTGTLTGFQWAKMLLAAVGFGANGEFTGTSWSLNTARVAHEAGLFDGDLSGADHVNLSRQQAALYAFNTLTEIKQVTYTSNANNYVYGIRGYWFADGTGKTLGWSVFDLRSVEGQIIDNEGMGNKNTIIDVVDVTEDIAVNAETGLDLMYHAVRQWYVDNKTHDGVFTMDLATVTTYECLDMGNGKDDVADLEKKDKTVEEPTIGELGKAYEAYLIDNTALDLDYDYAYVTLKAAFGVLGYAGKTDTNVGGNKVDNDDIKTDISDIAYGDEIVYVKAESTKSTGEAWYVYPVTYTEGVIEKITKEDGVVVSLTLEDGTVLPISVFWYGEQEKQDDYVLGQIYSFALDTHGDVIYATKDNVRDLYYYTGDSRRADEWGSWSSDRVREYRFYNVSTGEEYIVPIADAFTTLDEGSYYDIRVTAANDGLYVATEVTAGQNPYANEYVIDNFVATEGATHSIADGELTDDVVYFDLDEITFLVVSDSGADMVCTPYEGIDALAEEYNIATNGYYFLENACFTVTGTLTGHKYANVVFVAEEDLTSYSKYVFIPEDVAASKWTTITGDGYSYDMSYSGAYLDGEKITVVFDSDDTDLTDGKALERGFYTYVTNNGKSELVGRVEDGLWCGYENVKFVQTGTGAGANWTLDGIDAVDGEVTIVDLTKENEAFDLASLYEYCTENKGAVKLAYTVNRVTGDVQYIYVVKAGWRNSVTLTENLANWTIVDGVANDIDPTDAQAFKFVVKFTGNHTYAKGDTLTITLNTGAEVTATCIGNNEFEFTLTWPGLDWTQATVEMTGAYATVKFAVAAEPEGSDKYDHDAASYYDPAASLKVAVGDNTTGVFGRIDGYQGAAGTAKCLVNGIEITGTYATDGTMTIPMNSVGPVWCDNQTFTFQAFSTVA